QILHVGTDQRSKVRPSAVSHQNNAVRIESELFGMCEQEGEGRCPEVRASAEIPVGGGKSFTKQLLLPAVGYESRRQVCSA
ncbi:MAG: hypothetical protein WBJ46_03260, partial [Rectinema sp.]